MTPRSRLKVELPVCPSCQHVGSRPAPVPSVTEIQNRAKNSALAFLEQADLTSDARDAANWSLAAKNAIAAALSCETILKIQAEGRR
jgi:hypothetical protein